MVTVYTPLSSAPYPISWRVVSCSSTLTCTFDLEPEHLDLLPGQVARVTLWGEAPASGSRSQVTMVISSRGPCSIPAFKSRAVPGITCTGSSLRMRTDIAKRPHGTARRREMWPMRWWTTFYIHQCGHVEPLALRCFALCKLIKPTMAQQFISIHSVYYEYVWPLPVKLHKGMIYTIWQPCLMRYPSISKICVKSAADLTAPAR